MKKIILKLMLMTGVIATLLFAISMSASAYTDGIFTYTLNSGKATVTGCTNPVGEIVIPSTLGGYPVTTIGSYAFRGCTGLTSVTIPDNVTSIDNEAFENCTGLTSVTIPNSIKLIGYSGAIRLNAVSSSSSLGGGGGVGSGGGGGGFAFSGCTALTKVNISDIASWCNINFNGSSSNPLYYGKLYLNGNLVTNLTIPDSVNEIGAYAFFGYDALTSVTFGNSVTTIGSSAFEECTGLTSVTIPESVTTIGSSAFEECTGLTSVTIGNSVTTIGSYAFYKCTGLTKVNISDISAWCNIEFSNYSSNPLCYGKLYLNGNLVTNLTIPDSVTTIGSYAFFGYDALTSVTFGNSVTTIGSSAFKECTGLTSVAIPDSVTTIGDSTFYSCERLTSVMIGNSVTTIGSSAFYKCTGLTKVNISDISAWCNIEFSNYSSNPLCYGKLYLNGNLVTNLTIPDSVTTIGSDAFYNCTGLASVTIGNSVTTIGSSAFYNCTGLASVTIGNSVTTIGSDAFYNCTGLTSVTIGNSVTTIGSSAFYNCTGLASVTIGNSVTTIGDYAFYKCTGLTSVTIGDGVELIPEYAFYGCGNLEYVGLSKNLKYIRNDAFNSCSNIRTVFYAGDETEWANILFYNRNENLTNAKIIYNASKKTYSFETNCDAALEDITDYGVFTSPYIKNDGSTFVGWYDNASLNGEAITFPYYGEATTLYAAWTDKTGKSFDDAFEAKANREYTVTTTDNGQMVYFEFVPKLSKQYHFYTTGSKDTYGYLYNSNRSQLTSNDDNGDGNNFRISYTLTAGQTYYIAMKIYSGSGNFTFVIEEPVDYRINSVTINDFSGNSLSSIPMEKFLATVSFTNVSANADTVIILGQYSEDGDFEGLTYVQTEGVPTGSTIKVSVPVDNTSGDIARLKAFCRESLGSLVPMGNVVSFPAE